MRTVYLHIGLPKTGTSVIQRTLSASTRFLEDNDLLYPTSVQHSLFHDSGHHLLAIQLMLERWEELALPIDKVLVEQTWDRLLEELAGSARANVFLSSEWFAFDVHQHEAILAIREKLGDFRVKIIITLRKVHDLVNSLYAQRIRDGYAGTMDEYLLLAWPHLNWSALVERWRSVFGTDDVLIVNYEELRPERFVADFVDTLGGWRSSALDGEATNHPSNTRLPPDFIDVIMRINRHGLRPDIRHDIVNSLVDVIRQRGLTSEPRNYLSPIAEAALSHYCVHPARS